MASLNAFQLCSENLIRCKHLQEPDGDPASYIRRSWLETIHQICLECMALPYICILTAIAPFWFTYMLIAGLIEIYQKRHRIHTADDESRQHIYKLVPKSDPLITAVCP
jgi:hypothetical protein